MECLPVAYGSKVGDCSVISVLQPIKSSKDKIVVTLFIVMFLCVIRSEILLYVFTVRVMLHQLSHHSIDKLNQRFGVDF